MEVYLVGGAVRDALLDLPVTDRDWVVVGATPETLLAHGFLPVGKDFPVFLHPRTHEEYALARTERKIGPGYHGFSVHAAPDVTLEEDLARRDLTVNAMAVRTDCAQPADLLHAPGTTDPARWEASGVLIDPFGGRKDIAAKRLRHVTASFREDPVRILRVARLAARFADFAVAPETMHLMRDMVQCGEVDHLVAERVWQELATGLMENTPSRMFGVLRDCGALVRLLPELPWASKTGSLPSVLDVAARLQATLPVRVACLWLSSATKELESDPHLFKRLAQRLRLPNDCRELAEVVAREHDSIDGSAGLDPPALLDLLERCDGIRKPQRFADVLLACECAARAQPEASESPYRPARRLMMVLASVQAVDTQGLATQAMVDGLVGKHVGERIRQARIAAIGEGVAAASGLKHPHPLAD